MNRKIIWEKWIEPEIKMDKTDDSEPNLPVLFTPIGFLSQKLYAGLKNDMKFWVGNTNFTLTDEDINVIDHTVGVEVFNILTPLKFRFSPGKAFKARDIKQDIEINLDCENRYNLDESNIYSMRSTILQLKKAKIPWLVFILPNGKWEYYQNENTDIFNTTLAQYEEAKKLISGHIIRAGV